MQVLTHVKVCQKRDSCFGMLGVFFDQDESQTLTQTFPTATRERRLQTNHPNEWTHFLPLQSDEPQKEIGDPFRSLVVETILRRSHLIRVSIHRRRRILAVCSTSSPASRRYSAQTRVRPYNKGDIADSNLQCPPLGANDL